MDGPGLWLWPIVLRGGRPAWDACRAALSVDAASLARPTQFPGAVSHQGRVTGPDDHPLWESRAERQLAGRAPAKANASDFTAQIMPGDGRHGMVHALEPRLGRPLQQSTTALLRHSAVRTGPLPPPAVRCPRLRSVVPACGPRLRCAACGHR